MQAMCREAVATIRGDVAALTTLSGVMAELGLSGRAIAVARRAATDRDGDRGPASRQTGRGDLAPSPVRPTTPPRAGRWSGPATVPVSRSSCRRETEVAALAGDGLTDREIAARLVLSVRTIESHLACVYRKLGITSRLALAGMFERVA